MPFPNPFAAVIDFLGGGDPPPDALYRSNPSNQSRLANKYQPNTPFSQALAAIPQPIAQSFTDYELQRVRRGQSPLTEAQSLAALRTAVTGQAYTPEKSKSFGQRVVSDVTNLASTVPRFLIPSSNNPLVKEGQALTRLPELIPKALAPGGTKAIGNLAMLPGARLIPGSYIAGNVLGGTDTETGAKGSPGQLAEHPLFTVLDALPLAQHIAARTPVVSAAKGAYIKQLETLASSGDVASEARAATLNPPRPLQTLLTRKLAEGEVVPNRLGGALTSTLNAAKSTRTLGWADDMFSEAARNLSRLEARHTARLREEASAQSVVGADDPLAALAKRQDEMAHRVGSYSRYSSIDATRAAELTRILEQGDPAAISSLPDLDQAFITDIRDLTKQQADMSLSLGDLVEVEVGGKPWVYDVPTGQRILNARRRVAQMEPHIAVRSSLDGTAPLAPDVLATTLAADTPNFSLLEGQLHALTAQGYDTASIFNSLKQAKKSGSYTPELVDTIKKFQSSLPRRTVIDLAEVTDRLTPLARRDPQIAKFTDAISSGRYQDAIHLARNRLASRTRYNVIDDLPQILDELVAKRQADRYLARTSQFTPRVLARAQRTAAALERKLPPAAVDPLLQTKVSEAVQTRLKAKGYELSVDPDVVDTWLRLAEEHNYGHLTDVLPKSEYRAIQRDIRSTWQSLIDDGADPIFVHRVAPAAEGVLDFPRITDRIITPSQVRARTADATPYMQDATVALKHSGLEYLSRRGAEAFIKEVADLYGRPTAELESFYRDVALKQVGIDDPALIRPKIQQLMDREWVEYNPSTYTPWASNKLQQFPEGIRVPKSIKRNMDRMFNPKPPGVSAAFDPIMHAFRTSLLPLSGRWHINNIMGGGIMTAAQTSPLALIKYWREASEMTKAARAEGRAFLPDGAPPGGMVSVPRDDILRWNETAGTRERVIAASHYLGGQKMRDLLEQHWSHGQGFFSRFVDKSYAFNGVVDDMYRAITYLYGKDKASRLGLSEEAAKASGVALVRKTMPSFDQMTPLERSVMKSVFPFVTWMQHVMRYAYSYPYDHPFRVAVTASFARNERADMGSGLPERFMQMFFVGEPDAKGNVTAVNIGGMNPFADLSNYFTLSGFLGNTNPVISATLKTIGYDVGKGGPVLYPELNVDPFTGQLVAAGQGNLLTNLIEATVPQTRILSNLAGRNAEWKSLLANNPESAARMLQSQLGLPILLRDINVPQEQFKAELNRQRSQSTALSNAMRSGNYSEAAKYPGLRAMLDQIKALDQSGQLDQYRPQELTTIPGQ